MEYFSPQPVARVRRTRPIRGVSLVTRAIAWTGGLLSTFVGAALSRRRATDFPLRLTVGQRRRRRPTARERSFARLRWALMGNTKQAIATVFGLPQTAVAAGPIVGNTDPVYQADTWYYPLDHGRHTAIAIEFNRNEVARVEFLGLPT